jgi:hypothetical protein
MAKNSSNILALGVGLNLDPLNQDIANAAKTAKEGMAVVGQSVVDGGAKASGATEKLGDKVQTMRQQLRLATQDAQAMAEKYGIMSTQAIASASRAGELKDKIGDINTVITAFSADSKFTVVAGAMQSAAGAASIVTGAMGLLGTESKATQEMLLKVQSALALTQGLAQIKEMGASFTALRAVIVGQVIPSIAAMGTATIVATGGAILIIGALVAAVTMYNDQLDREAAALKLVNDEQERNNDAIASSQQIIIETQNLRTRALKDGLEKELRQNKDKLAIELYDNELAYSKGTISATTFGQRKVYIQDFYANEEDKIRKAAALKKIEDDKKAAALELQNLKIQLAQVVDIKSQFQGGGQSNLPGLKAPLAPTTPILSNKNSPANQIMKQTEDARNAMIRSKIILEEGIENMYSGLKQITDNSIANIFGTVGQTIGDSLAASLSGETTDMMDAIGVAIVKSLGQMAVQVGSMLIAMSVPMIIAGIPQGYAYALAGAGLIAVGATVSGLAGRKSQSAPTPTNNTPTSNLAPNSNYIGGQNSGQLVIQGYVRGNDINFVNGKSGSKNNRNLRFG